MWRVVPHALDLLAPSAIPASSYLEERVSLLARVQTPTSSCPTKPVSLHAPGDIIPRRWRILRLVWLAPRQATLGKIAKRALQIAICAPMRSLARDAQMLSIFTMQSVSTHAWFR